ncbi:MAG: neutral/alkaline non-lysosomal ceramidase N-terminal domain-containing protein [Imperialibacter sp.]
MKRLLKVLAWVAGAVLVLALSLLTTIDRTPYQEMAYYAAMHARMDSLTAVYQNSVGDTLQVGWAEASLVYPESIPLAGYGKRKGAHFEGVHDSVGVKTMVFSNGKAKAAIVSFDLLITPPEVVIRLKNLLPSLGYSMQNTFFTAVHSHCSIGAWSPGLTGTLFAGTYQPEVADFIAEAVIQSIKDAEGSREKAKIGFATFDAGELIYNRLVKENGTIDPWFRVMKVVKDSGKSALFTTFAAHATTLPSSFLALSADYPAALRKTFVADSLADFVIYGAGAVGSQGPNSPKGIEGWDKAEYISEHLADQFAQISFLIQPEYVTSISSGYLPLELRQPSFKVSESIAARPWVFYWLFGDYDSGISYLKIGDNLLVGTPCDFSGELMAPLDSMARAQGQNLMVTSFNGGYIGYITKDEWYDLNKYETRTMNWFGPYNGAYFSEIIGAIVETTTE